IELALVWISRAIRQNQLEFEPPVICLDRHICREAATVLEILLLARRKVHLDGVERGNCGDRSARRAYEGSNLLLGGSRDTVDKGCHAGETKIDTSRFDRGLGGLNRGGSGRDLSLGGLYLCLGVGIDKTVECADPFAVDRNVSPLDLGHGHGEGR